MGSLADTLEPLGKGSNRAFLRATSEFPWDGESASRFFWAAEMAIFLSNCWCRYRSRILVRSVTISCSSGWSLVGTYMAGRVRELDCCREAVALSLEILVKFSRLYVGKSFKKSLSDILWPKVMNTLLLEHFLNSLLFCFF